MPSRQSLLMEIYLNLFNKKIEAMVNDDNTDDIDTRLNTIQRGLVRVIKYVRKNDDEEKYKSDFDDDPELQREIYGNNDPDNDKYIDDDEDNVDVSDDDEDNKDNDYSDEDNEDDSADDEDNEDNDDSDEENFQKYKDAFKMMMMGYFINEKITNHIEDYITLLFPLFAHTKDRKKEIEMMQKDVKKYLFNTESEWKKEWKREFIEIDKILKNL